MAMAVSCNSALGVAFSSLASVSTCAVSASSSQWKPACAPFSGHSVVLNSGNSSSVVNAPISSVSVASRSVVTKAAADVLEASTGAAEEAPAPAITTILSEAELIKKKAKRDELRRKRLVRKRKLRKKGRWPPSKMAKLKNV